MTLDGKPSKDWDCVDLLRPPTLTALSMTASSVQDSLEAAREAKDPTEVRAMLGKIETRIDALIDAARAATTETKEQAVGANRA